METFSARLNSLTFGIFIIILGWAPFPLGSNRPWSAAFLLLLIAACWCLWVFARFHDGDIERKFIRRLVGPGLFAGAAFAWGVIQLLPFVPSTWAHPLWLLASQALERDLPGTISLSPSRTGFELLKLGGYAAVFVMACLFARQYGRAARILDSIVAICSGYAVYALVLWTLQIRQFQIFYSTVPVGDLFSGPFVLHNSYATFAGMGAVCAAAKLFQQGSIYLRTDRGPRAFFLSLSKFVFGLHGAPYALALLLTFSTVVLSASRAGFVATLFGFVAMMICAVPLLRGAGAMLGAAAAAAVTGGSMLLLFLVSGDTLQARLDALADLGGPDPLRRIAWESAVRMIESSPWRGLGLGSFEIAQPLYSDQVVRAIMDKAHCDYLELAAGLGVPAASALLISLLWLIALCLRAVFHRKRQRVYAVCAIGASALVGLHSAFDFSLQIPAVAVLYAAILGMGIGQAFSKRAAKG